MPLPFVVPPSGGSAQSPHHLNAGRQPGRIYWGSFRVHPTLPNSESPLSPSRTTGYAPRSLTMKRSWKLLLVFPMAVSSREVLAVEPPTPYGPLPTAAQLFRQTNEFYGF